VFIFKLEGSRPDSRPIAVCHARLAALDSAGLSHINGFQGSLEDNISELRELNMYYLFWLYLVELHR
jgi:hypothetical protein